MSEQTYSLAKIAEKIGRPSTTVVTWKDRFIEYIPVIDGPKPRYPELALEIFKAIHTGYTKGMETDQIKVILSKKYPINVTNESPTDVQSEELITNVPPTNELIEQNKVLLQAMGMLKEELSDIRQELSELRQSNENINSNTNTLVEESKSLREEIKQDREWAVHKVEDTLKKIEENKNNPWWSKWWK